MTERDTFASLVNTWKMVSKLGRKCIIFVTTVHLWTATLREWTGFVDMDGWTVNAMHNGMISKTPSNPSTTVKVIFESHMIT
jgi:hypothetical protein